MKYEPWKQLGQTELEYWKKTYLETRKDVDKLEAENARLKKENKTLREEITIIYDSLNGG